MDLILSPVMEDYMETIFRLIAKENTARVTDIAKKMKVTMATVTSALRKLASKELINYHPYSAVSFTQKGKDLAAKIVMRHQVLEGFFKDVLLVPPAIAKKNACRMEHQMDDVLLNRLIEFIHFACHCPSTRIKWRNRQAKGKPKNQCEKCNYCNINKME